MNRKINIVAIGGRTGPSLIAKGFYGNVDYDITAIVAVSDSGSSTGVIRRNFDTPAVGDIRTVITELADISGPLNLLKELFEFRFKPKNSKDMEKMALGNLFLTALTKMGEEAYGLSTEDSFKKAIELTGEMFQIKGKVFPVSTENIHLCAELVNGSIMVEEVNVRQENKPRIKEIFFQDVRTGKKSVPKVLPECKYAIEDADLIIIGPGGLYCSILACLAIEGVITAFQNTNGRKIYIANTTTQPGQTDGYTILDHVKEINKYVNLDYVLLNTYEPPTEILNVFSKANINYMPLTKEDLCTIKEMGIKPITKNLMDETKTKPDFTKHKMDTIPHDVIKVSKAIREICRVPCLQA